MFIYNVIYVLTICGILFTYNKYDKKNNTNNFLYFLLSAIIVLTVCLHGESVGHDTHTYLYLYMHPEHIGFNDIEFVLPRMAAMLRVLYPNPYFINFFILLIAQIPIFLLINKYSPNRFLSIFLYISYSCGVSMFLLSMVAVRQALALGFFALSLYMYKRNNDKVNWKVVISLLLMFFSHTSSVLVMPLFLISQVYISKKIYYVIGILSCVIGFFVSSYSGRLVDYAALIEQEFYFSKDVQESSALLLVPFVVPFLYMVYVLPKEKLQTIWVKGMFLLVIMTGIIYPIAQNLDRISSYYYLTALMAIPELLCAKQHNIKKIVLHGFNMTILAYFSYKFYVVFDILSASEYPFVPYKTFLAQ